MNVSVIIPCYNELKFIEKCLVGILDSCKNSGLSYEVIISDGGSDDGTLDVLSNLKKRYERLSVLHNPKRLQVYALNQLIDASVGEVVIRCDAHAEYQSDYVKVLYDYLLENPDVGNAGFQVKTATLNDGNVSKAVSCCLSSKFGVGASHRSSYADSVIDCDTVLFGAWRREVLQIVGGFDLNFVRGQDLEHNLRLKKFGFRVVQLPKHGVVYYTRDTYKKLFKMMMQYASVKPALIKCGYGMPNIRSFIPIGFYVCIISSLMLNPIYSLMIFLVYFFMAVIFSVYESNKANSISLSPYLLLGFLLQHLGHAFGMVLGIQVIFSGKYIRWGSTR